MRNRAILRKYRVENWRCSELWRQKKSLYCLVFVLILIHFMAQNIRTNYKKSIWAAKFRNWQLDRIGKQAWGNPSREGANVEYVNVGENWHLHSFSFIPDVSHLVLAFHVPASSAFPPTSASSALTPTCDPSWRLYQPLHRQRKQLFTTLHNRSPLGKSSETWKVVDLEHKSLSEGGWYVTAKQSVWKLHS